MLVTNCTPKEIETIEIKHFTYNDGAKGFNINITFPPEKVEKAAPKNDYYG